MAGYQNSPAGIQGYNARWDISGSPERGDIEIAAWPLLSWVRTLAAQGGMVHRVMLFASLGIQPAGSNCNHRGDICPTLV